MADDPVAGPAARSEAATGRRVSRAGGDVEVVLRPDGETTRLAGTWRRVGLRALWATPIVGIEAGVLIALALLLPALRAIAILVGALLAVRHLVRGLGEMLGVVRGWLVVSDDGWRGLALGWTSAARRGQVRWDEVAELRHHEIVDGPVLSPLPRTGSGQRALWRWRPGAQPALRPDAVPTERLLDLLAPPPEVPVALGAPDDDPRDVTVTEEGVGVWPARGRPISLRWEAVTAVEVVARGTVGGRLARSVEVLGERQLTAHGPSREELVAVPATRAEAAGLVDALERLAPGLPARVRSAGEGTTALWERP